VGFEPEAIICLSLHLPTCSVSKWGLNEKHITQAIYLTHR
jgi:hypothetical protein